MIWVMNHAELDLNLCRLFVNILYHKQQLKKRKADGGGSLVVEKTLNMAFVICDCTVVLNKFGFLNSKICGVLLLP